MNAHELKQLQVRLTKAKAERDPATIEAVNDDDAQVSKILDYIDKDIEEHPEHLIKPDPEMLAELDELVDGIEIDDLPEDIIMAALKAAHAFIDVMLSFYGTDLDVANWHMNGDMEHWDRFFDDNMSDQFHSSNSEATWRDVGGRHMTPVLFAEHPTDVEMLRLPEAKRWLKDKKAKL